MIRIWVENGAICIDGLQDFFGPPASGTLPVDLTTEAPTAAVVVEPEPEPEPVKPAKPKSSSKKRGGTREATSSVVAVPEEEAPAESPTAVEPPPAPVKPVRARASAAAQRVQKIVSDMMSRNRRTEISDVLAEFGCAGLAELQPSQYEDFALRLEEAAL